MSIQAAFAVPHPPLIVPAVGRGQEREIASTIGAFQEVAKRTAALNPDVIVISSPHAPAYRDGFFVSLDESEQGSMAAFGQPQESLSVTIDQPFAQAIAEQAHKRGIPVAQPARGHEQIDHGTYVPLYFLSKELDLTQMPIVRVGLSGLSDEEHRQFGRAISEAANQLGRRVVFIASGDWSHRLKEDGPYGFTPEGPQFDHQLADIFRSGDLEEMFKLNPQLCEEAGECGLRSFEIMTGALEGQAFESELLSYEGPFGVGYGVAAIEVVDNPSSSAEELQEEQFAYGADPLVALARTTVETYVTSGMRPNVPADFPKEYLHERAGVFVSLHERGDLRGCIGTIEPQQHSIAEEVITNGVSAATADPRFPPVQPDELDWLSYSVDVLGKPEPVDSLLQLDPKRYGVIVSRGWKRGLLLPDLEGVDTVEDQLAIAKRKAGLAPTEDVRVERFEVIRHSAGGEARRG